MRHVIEKHKEEIISKFRVKVTPTKNNDNNKLYNSQNISINPSYNNNIDNNKNKQNKYKQIDKFGLESIYQNNAINTYNDNKGRATPITSRNNQNMKQNIKFHKNETLDHFKIKNISLKNKIYYCGKKK